MYHSSHAGLRTEASRLNIGQTSVAAGKGDATSVSWVGMHNDKCNTLTTVEELAIAVVLMVFT